MRKAVQLLLLFMTLSILKLGHAEDKKPSVPPETIPDLQSSNAVGICVGCERPFDTKTHKKVLDGLVNNPYVEELRKALYLQDTFHQFESKAHFDNCDFDGSLNYIASLLSDADSHVKTAIAAKQAGNNVVVEQSVRRAFFSLGQALHGVQDFYAHSNYVELQVSKVKRVADIAIIPTWRKDAQEPIARLRAEGLVSGVVFWGFPQKCPTGTASHSDLAKDADSTASGRRLVAHLQNVNLHTIATLLAREASIRFMEDAFRRWPLLKEVNGREVAFEILVDRRGM